MHPPVVAHPYPSSLGVRYIFVILCLLPFHGLDLWFFTISVRGGCPNHTGFAILGICNTSVWGFLYRNLFLCSRTYRTTLTLTFYLRNTLSAHFEIVFLILAHVRLRCWCRSVDSGVILFYLRGFSLLNRCSIFVLTLRIEVIWQHFRIGLASLLGTVLWSIRPPHV